MKLLEAEVEDAGCLGVLLVDKYLGSSFGLHVRSLTGEDKCLGVEDVPLVGDSRNLIYVYIDESIHLKSMLIFLNLDQAPLAGEHLERVQECLQFESIFCFGRVQLIEHTIIYQLRSLYNGVNNSSDFFLINSFL